jgi:hypothetical protein
LSASARFSASPVQANMLSVLAAAKASLGLS